MGYLHCGPAGAGHFVKMVHNGIEYALMAAYAEGLTILHHANAGSQQRSADAETAPLTDPELYRYDLDIPKVAEVWRRGSVVASWLLDLTAAALHGITRPRRVQRARQRLGRRALDGHRRDRRGRPRAGDRDRALRPLHLAGHRRLHEQDAVGDAQAVRRPRREEGLTYRGVTGAAPSRAAAASRCARRRRCAPRAPGGSGCGRRRSCSADAAM